MRIKRPTTSDTARLVRHAGMIAVASGLIAATMMTAPIANAAPTTPDSVAALTRSLGADATAGSYYDTAARTTVINVTTDAAARSVWASGAVPRWVGHSFAQLRRAGRATRAAGIAGTAWAVDPRSDQLVVTVDRTVGPAALARLKHATAGYGDAVRVEHSAGKFSRLLSGGDAIYGGGYRCSLGFNVHKGSSYYFLTAGHCGQVASTWYADSGQSTVVGSTAGYTFPGHDYALVQYTDPGIPHPSSVGGQSITRAANAYVGESVKRRGSTTGVHGGTVTGLNATVNYGNGDVVSGLIQTNVCAEPGDSGGSLYSGSTALGLTSGGSGDCSSGGTTFFQPVTAALSHFGVSLP